MRLGRYANYRYTISRRVSKACYEHSQGLMRIAIDFMSSHIANLDLDISRTKSVLFSTCPSVLRRDITNFVRMLNSRLVSPPEDQFGSLELFIRQCRHDIDILPKFRPNRPLNLTKSELSALKSLRARNDIVIKPADKGGALVVWRGDLYGDEAHR